MNAQRRMSEKLVRTTIEDECTSLRLQFSTRPFAKANNRDHTSNPPSENSLEALFWSKVSKKTPEECWQWQGTLANHGAAGKDYGLFTKHPFEQLAHRIAWIFTFGPIPAGMVVMHGCDYPRCVNPRHLRLGTSADNVRDRHLKGRTWSILTVAQVLEARSRYVKWCRKNGAAAIARDFGVGVTTMHDALKGQRCWKEIANP